MNSPHSNRNNKMNKNPLYPFMIAVLTISLLVIISKNSFVGKCYDKMKSIFLVSLSGEENEYSPEVFNEESLLQEEEKDDDFIPTMDNIDEVKTFEEVKRYLYTIDETAYADEELLDINKLLDIDVKMESSKEPKILIFHTHSQENFIDSEEDNVEDTIVGVGTELADILAEDYGIKVVHDFGEYDVVDGRTERGASYERMEPIIQNILAKYPSIEVLIDLHRDGVRDDVHLVTDIEGEKVAKLMFFNGVTCLRNGNEGQNIDSLPNPYLNENLAFGLKMQLAANELYPSITRKIYIKPYRYSLHMMPKSLLVEVGANTSTVQEAKNAMKYLAKILNEVIN